MELPAPTRGFACTCPPRFSGATCEYDLDPCAGRPCLHGAKCVNLKNDFHCECPARMSGKRCHYGHHCNPNPCQNGGMCEEGGSGPICKCRGFTGPLCSHDINECLHQVWSLTQFYAVDFSNSRISVKKCVFNECTFKVCINCS